MILWAIEAKVRAPYPTEFWPLSSYSYLNRENAVEVLETLRARMSEYDLRVAFYERREVESTSVLERLTVIGRVMEPRGKDFMGEMLKTFESGEEE